MSPFVQTGNRSVGLLISPNSMNAFAPQEDTKTCENYLRHAI